MQSLPSFIRSTLKDGAVDQHLNVTLAHVYFLRNSRNVFTPVKSFNGQESMLLAG